MGTMANMLGKHFAYTVPVFRRESLSRLCHVDRGKMVMVETMFRAGDHSVEGEVLLFFGHDCLDRLSNFLSRFEEQFV